MRHLQSVLFALLYFGQKPGAQMALMRMHLACGGPNPSNHESKTVGPKLQNVRSRLK